MDTGSLVLSIYCAHMASKWGCVLENRHTQGRNMSVEVYYDQFFNWKTKLEEVNYIGGEESYTDDFLFGLRTDISVRVWMYKLKPRTLYGAFRRAEIEEFMLSRKENSRINDANKVFEEMTHPESINSAELQGAEVISDENSDDVLDAPSFVATEEGFSNMVDTKAINSVEHDVFGLGDIENKEDDDVLHLKADNPLVEMVGQSFPSKPGVIEDAHRMFDEMLRPVPVSLNSDASLFRDEGNDYLSSKIKGLQIVCQLNEEMYANCLFTKFFDTGSSFLIDDDVGLTARTNFSVFGHLVSIGVIGVDLRSYVWKLKQYMIPYILEDKDVVKRNGIGVRLTLTQDETLRLIFDPGAETAAALAASSIVFKDSDPSYSTKLLKTAMKVFEFVDKHRGSYNDSLSSVICPFYFGEYLQMSLKALEVAHEEIALSKYLWFILDPGGGIEVEAGKTQVCKFILSHQHPTAEYLVEHGAEAIDCTNLRGYTALHLVADIGQERIMRLSLSKCAKVEHDLSKTISSPLERACPHGKKECVKLLLDNGANPNSFTKNFSTPLMPFIADNSYDCMELLLKAGADPNLGLLGRTHLLLAEGDDTYRYTVYDRNSLLHIAASNGQIEVICWLLNRSVNPDSLNLHNQTPLLLASMHGIIMCAEILIETGANVSITFTYDLAMFISIKSSLKFRSDTHEDFRPANKLPSSGHSLENIVEHDVKENPVMIYMKRVPDLPCCGFNSLAVRVLNEYSVPISVRIILEDLELKNAVKSFSHWPTFEDGFCFGFCSARNAVEVRNIVVVASWIFCTATYLKALVFAVGTEVENFVWNLGIFLFTTLRTRRLLRGRICHIRKLFLLIKYMI